MATVLMTDFRDRSQDDFIVRERQRTLDRVLASEADQWRTLGPVNDDPMCFGGKTEVMGHAHTDPAVYDTVVDFARRIGMVPIELRKEQPGYVVNSLQVPFLQAAQALVVKGVADPATVDKAWRTATGAPHGPFQALDVIGLRTAYNIDAVGDEESKANARYLKEHYIDQGKLGRATGEGFYKYDTVASRS